MKKAITMTRPELLQALLGYKDVRDRMYPNIYSYPTANLRAMLVRRTAPAEEQEPRNIPRSIGRKDEFEMVIISMASLE